MRKPLERNAPKSSPARGSQPRSGGIVSYRDAGRYLTYIRLIARRNAGIELQPYCWPDGSFALPYAYEPKEIAAS